MNRLWVRLSLTFGLIILLVGVLPGIIFVLFDDQDLIVKMRNYLIDDLQVVELLNLSQGDIDLVTQKLVPEFRQDQLDAIISYTLTAIILGLIAGVWVSRTLSAPLDKLVDATTAVASHNLDHRVSIKAKAAANLLP